MGKFYFLITDQLWLIAIAGSLKLPDGVRIIEIKDLLTEGTKEIIAEADNMGIDESSGPLPLINPVYQFKENGDYEFITWFEGIKYERKTAETNRIKEATGEPGETAITTE